MNAALLSRQDFSGSNTWTPVLSLSGLEDSDPQSLPPAKGRSGDLKECFCVCIFCFISFFLYKEGFLKPLLSAVF